MGQVSNGLLMTPMTTVSVTNPNMSAVSMGYSSAGGGTSRSGISHSGPQSKLFCQCVVLNGEAISTFIFNVSPVS